MDPASVIWSGGGWPRIDRTSAAHGNRSGTLLVCRETGTIMSVIRRNNVVVKGNLVTCLWDTDKDPLDIVLEIRTCSPTS